MAFFTSVVKMEILFLFCIFLHYYLLAHSSVFSSQNKHIDRKKIDWVTLGLTASSTVCMLLLCFSPDLPDSCSSLCIGCPHGNLITFSANVNDHATHICTVFTKTLSDETQQLHARAHTHARTQRNFERNHSYNTQMCALINTKHKHIILYSC